MRLVEAAGVAAIPLSAFYVSDKPRHHVRFAFCKRISVLDEAVGRLTRYFGAHQGSGHAALTAAE
jgi:N-succinyldiaminopimelate aminotransferase